MEKLVAIVGRPNVGKSTLFNRLVEQRKAIIDNESGVTRDRHYGVSTWNGRNFTVVDTGGYIQKSDDIFEQAIRHQVQIALAEADIVLFLVDCMDGLLGMDQALADVLRTTKKPVFLLANKADSIERNFVVHEFHALGMGEPYPISAANGSGTGEVLDAVVQKFPIEYEDPATDAPPRIAILGRPNVGKSSLLNALLGSERNIVTPIPGTTRDAIDTHYKLYGKNLILTDTAGIRKKSKVKEDIEFYSVLRAIRALQSSDVCIIMLDASLGLEAQDLQIISLANRYRKGILVLVNKWDLVSDKQPEVYKKQLLKNLTPLDYVEILFISALTKQRIHKAIDTVIEIAKKRNQRISTSKLNQVMLAAIEAHHPPAVNGKYIRIKYVTQLHTRTPVFAFFCNLPQYIKVPYKRYLINQLRASFDFKGVPIEIVFRKK